MRSTTELAIQKRLRDKGLNKEEICKQTGITSERLEKLEKGKAKPAYKEIGLLADYFHIAPEAFLYTESTWRTKGITLILAVFATLLDPLLNLYPNFIRGICSMQIKTCYSVMWSIFM